MRPITVDGRSPERKASIAATMAAASWPRKGGTFVSAEAAGGWQPEHDVAPGGGAAAAAARTSGTAWNTLTRFPPDLGPGVGTLSRSAGDGLHHVRLIAPHIPSPASGEG
jgi:hypothetical protein